MTKIIRCQISNVLGARQIELEPNGSSVTIGGKNGQGKSSAIKALAMALAGRNKIPEKGIYEGAESGGVWIELDNFNVELSLDHDREKIKLKVLTKKGKRISSPQTFLDQVFGDLSFDPGQFKYLSGIDRRSKLLALVGLDFTDLDLRREDLAEERKRAHRERVLQEGRLAGLEFIPELPVDEISIEQTMQALQSAMLHNASGESLKKEIDAGKQKITAIKNEIERLTTELDTLKLKVDQQTEQLKVFQSIDIDALKTETVEIQAKNNLIRRNREFMTERHRLDELKRNFGRIELEIEKIEDEKREKLRTANWPLDGLGFDGDDVTFNYIPFFQLSESQQWHIATAIAFKINPKGIVFMANSGGLDRESRDAIRNRAAELGVQLFLEVVDDAEDVEILIEEGLVKENRLFSHLEA